VTTVSAGTRAVAFHHLQSSVADEYGTHVVVFYQITANDDRFGLCWLHGLSAGQIENFLLQLSGALTTKYTLGQAREERPCFLGLQLTDDEAHLSRVCFLSQDKRKTTACWFSTQRQACKTFL